MQSPKQHDVSSGGSRSESRTASKAMNSRDWNVTERLRYSRAADCAGRARLTKSSHNSAEESERSKATRLPAEYSTVETM